MCPLRFILVFLSATLAGFFLLRNLKSEQPQLAPTDDDTHLDNPKNSPNRFSKVGSAMESGFWTFVDMASGRYLWRHLVTSSAKSTD